MKYNVVIVRAYFEEMGLPDFVTEHEFARRIEYERKDGRMGERKWRFDFAWLQHKLALEVEGGVFSGGRHTRGAGFANDMLKYNTATLLGWRVLRVQPKDLCTQQTINMIHVALNFNEY